MQPRLQLIWKREIMGFVWDNTMLVIIARGLFGCLLNAVETKPYHVVQIATTIVMYAAMVSWIDILGEQ